VALGLAVAVVGPIVLTVIVTGLRDHLGLPSILLLFLLLVAGVSAAGGLLPALLAAVSGFLLVNWYFTPPLHTFTISEGENVLALLVFLAVAGIVSRFVSLPARRAAEGARARSEAEALLRLAGSAPASAVLASLRRVLALDGASVLHRTNGGWRLGAASGDLAPESPESARTTIDLDGEQVLALAGGPVRSEDRCVLDAFAKELAASVELGDLEAEAQDAQAAPFGMDELLARLRAALRRAARRRRRPSSRPTTSRSTSPPSGSPWRPAR
jgi:two-component system, OmpR family, sensor histidine kinase KdpD